MLGIGLLVGVGVAIALWSQARVAGTDPSLSAEREAFLTSPVVIPSRCGLVTIPPLDQAAEPRFTIDQALQAKGQRADRLEFGTPDHSLESGIQAVRFWWSSVAAPDGFAAGKVVHLRLELTKGSSGWTVSDVALLGVLGRLVPTTPTENSP